ncbi:MAG: XdhC family protein [Desulfovibrionaceae bacterium]|nr:XdhC family protein [Desulfovibrionaceae bacterium]
MSIVESICRELKAKKRLALVSVVRQLASAPRHTGATMLVGEEGLVDGTIGGGILEKKALDRAREVIESGLCQFMDADLSAGEAASIGMICGGSVRLFLEPVQPDGRTTVLYERLLVAERCADDMFSVVPVTAPGQRRVCRVHADKWPLPVMVSHAVKDLMAETGLSCPSELNLGLGQHFVIEPWQSPWRVNFMGGGHVCLATAKIAALAGFTYTVTDDREEFSNSERFPDAAAVHTVPGFANCFEGLAPGRKSFVLILTRGHQHDRNVLSQALRTQAGYIGMIGSAKKMQAVFASLREEGFNDEDLARVNLPVGLSIGAETPEEIGVSIVAQLIAARAVQHGGRRHLDPALAGSVRP